MATANRDKPYSLPNFWSVSLRIINTTFESAYVKVFLFCGQNDIILYKLLQSSNVVHDIIILQKIKYTKEGKHTLFHF